MLSQQVVHLIKKYNFTVEVDKVFLPDLGRHLQISDLTCYDVVAGLTMDLMGVSHSRPIRFEVVGSTTTMLNDVCGFLSDVWKYCDPSTKAYVRRNWQVRDPQNDHPEIYVN